MADVVLSKKEALAITRCLLLGAVHEYDNYGHPERSSARQYHIYKGMGRHKWAIGYGYTQGMAAKHWLINSGYQSTFANAERQHG